jgi:aminopeptidase N
MRFPFWLKAALLSIPAVLLIVFLVLIALGWYVKSQMLASGGPLRPLMAAYDVRRYDLELAVDPNQKSIRGTNRVTVETVAVLDQFEIHLDDRLEVGSVDVDGAPAEFDHDDGLILVDLPKPWAVGDRHAVTIGYQGRPKRALKPPWIDGFVWSETPSGQPWVGVTGEADGGDDWWPCKDHPSDEPDEGMEIALTVPEGLVGLSNGRPLGNVVNADGTVTSRWRVGFPINNYCVTVNIGPYEPVEIAYHGVDGSLDERLVFWAIPEFVEDARRLWQQMPGVLATLGNRFGEYPFLADKFWVAHAPYLGMEHQTIVAYGAGFSDNDFGFDELLLHEVAHEWWGNKITASDWGDFWIHEGFASYAEALYVLDTLGEERYLDYMHVLRARMTNRVPVVEGADLTAAEAYSPDIYCKGAWVLHMLRLLVGDPRFDEIIWRFAGGDDPSACRFATTDDFMDLVEEVTTWDLSWFWQRYLFTAELPSWVMSRGQDGGAERIDLVWDDPAFEMPLPVQIGDRRRLVAMPGGRARFRVDRGTEVVVDPDREVLTAAP